jgi:hypothetical protein
MHFSEINSTSGIQFLTDLFTFTKRTTYFTSTLINT